MEPAGLHRRLAERARRRDADATVVTDELLATYLAGFETPDGEGEEVLTPDGAATWRPR